MIKNCSECLNQFETKTKKNTCSTNCMKIRKRRKSNEWKKKNNERNKKITDEWKIKHKEHTKIYNAKYFHQNKNKIHENRYKLRKKDDNFRISLNQRHNTSRHYRGKRNYKLIGCSKEFLNDWFLFWGDKYNYNDYGKIWNIDHFIPCIRFNLSDEKDLIYCFHWSNTRPILKENNYGRVNSSSQEIEMFNDKLKQFCETKNINVPNTDFDRLNYI